jgi:aminopeptidase C
MKELRIEIQDEDAKQKPLIYIIKRMNVAASNRRFQLYDKELSKELIDSIKNQRLFASSLVTVLCGEDGVLLYPAPMDGSDDDAVDKLFDDMFDDIYSILAKSFGEINPPAPGLKAKKKKY